MIFFVCHIRCYCSPYSGHQSLVIKSCLTFSYIILQQFQQLSTIFQELGNKFAINLIISPKKLKNTNYFFFYSASSSPSSIAVDTEMFISFIQNLCLSPPAKNSSSAVTTTTTITSSTFLLLCIRKISYIFSRTILSTSKIFLERTIELFNEVYGLYQVYLKQDFWFLPPKIKLQNEFFQKFLPYLMISQCFAVPFMRASL